MPLNFSLTSQAKGTDSVSFSSDSKCAPITIFQPQIEPLKDVSKVRHISCLESFKSETDINVETHKKETALRGSLLQNSDLMDSSELNQTPQKIPLTVNELLVVREESQEDSPIQVRRFTAST